MATYISSNNNRFYSAVESTFAQVPAIAPPNRLPAVELAAHQQLQQSLRRDKTGTRTFLGNSPLARRATAFSLSTYLTSWDAVNAPGYGPLLQSACGGVPSLCGQLRVSSMPDPLHLTTYTPHGLLPGNGVSQGSEVRFAASVVDPVTILLNAPFSAPLTEGALLAPCLTYPLGNLLPSVSLFDYWDPPTAIDRIVTGATVDTLNISLNGAFHEMTFSGLAADLLDSQSFSAGSAGLQSFPAEPFLSAFDYSIVAGNLGEAWLGFTAQQLFTLTAATIQIKNNLVPRNMEFGSIYPLSIAAGPRDVSLTFSLFADDSSTVKDLYLAAKQGAPLSVMFQLGQQQGQMMGIYLPSIIPELPLYDDREPRLIWDFKANIAQGTNNDELVIALA
jgi:hypothetical protein